MLAARHDDRCPLISAVVHPIHVPYDRYARLAGRAPACADAYPAL
ncbi:hypothetical protein QF027_000383 [Streptomyces canus]|nr:hypothetical protein [Streptomyces canus]